MKDGQIWQDELRLGLQLSRSGKFDEAFGHLQRAQENAPKNALAACALGREHMRREEYARARDLLQIAWDTDPSLLTAGTSLARCLALGLNEFDKAHEVLTQVEDELGCQPTTRLVRAELLLLQNRHEEAAIVAQALALHSDTATAMTARLLMSRVHNERGLAAVKQGAFDRAIFAFKTAQGLDPLWVAPICNLGATFEKLKRTRRAQKAYQEATMVDPSSCIAWQNLGRLYRKTGDCRALESLRRAHTADERDVGATAEYAAALFPDKPTRAKTILRNCATKTPLPLSAWLSLLSLLSKQGEFALAEHCIREAIRLASPEHRTRLYNLLSCRDKWASAIELMEKNSVP